MGDMPAGTTIDTMMMMLRVQVQSGYYRWPLVVRHRTMIALIAGTDCTADYTTVDNSTGIAMN
jgi:hypothetical protein